MSSLRKSYLLLAGTPALLGFVGCVLPEVEPQTEAPQVAAAAPVMPESAADPAHANASQPPVRTGSGMLAIGSPCAESAECASNMCTDGVCCNHAACADKHTCGADGECHLAASNTEPIGASCRDDAQCETGLCEDSVCCAQRCGICSSCLFETKGECAAISGLDDPGRCEGTHSCSQGRCVRVAEESIVEDPTHISLGSTKSTLRLAQTVRMTRGGELVEVRLYLRCVDPRALYVTLDREHPSVQGTEFQALDTQFAARWPPNGIDEGLDKRLTPFPLPRPLRVKAGDVLSIIAHTNDQFGCNWKKATRDGYARGTAVAFTESEQEWVDLEADLVFQVLTVE